MPACVPTRTTDSNRPERAHPPHSPPPARHRRPRIAGADLSAAVAVSLIALPLPLPLGIALATGAPLQAGLVAAAAGGIVAGRIDGSPLQVTDPAALVTSMITSSGPGDLFVVRNVGNLVPPPGEESGDDSVAAALEYAVEVLAVRSITVCGHSGCGAMQALLDPQPDGSPSARTPLRRWLRHGLPSLKRVRDGSGPWVRLAGRAPADTAEQLCLANVVQQLEHLRAHESVARALKDEFLTLHGLYFHVGEAQAYLLTKAAGEWVFDRVRAEDPTL
ncbi:hypothetical protein GCM10027162_01300 [Streptomyces incanus]